jgi:ABC-type multidrug transport system fused ATPase/permease subunit
MLHFWLTLVLDLVSTAMAILLVTLTVTFRSNSGFTGIALVNLVTFNQALQRIIQVWTSLDTSIGAVSRIRTFSQVTASEDLPDEIHGLPEEWPLHGEIVIRDVSASYT